MKLKYLLSLMLSAAFLGGCGVAHEPTVCTSAPESDWQNKDQFEKSLLQGGYEIKELKVTDGNCYEIYGKDPAGNKVEIYFNPVDGQVIKQESH